MKVSNPKLWLLAAALILAVAVFLIYRPAVRYGFVGLDDEIYVAGNPHVQGGLTGEGIKWAFTTFHHGFYIPATWLSYMADVTVFGPGAAGHHLVNILFHALNTVFVLLLLFKMTGRLPPSILVAAVLAVHPVHVESVAWVTERKDVLSMFFFLMTLAAYTSYTRRPSPGRYLPVAAFFLVGLAAKPMLVTLPVVLLLLDYWPLGRWPGSPGPTFPPLPAVVAPKTLLLEKVPLLLLSMGAAVATIAAKESVGEGIVSLAYYPPAARLGNALRSILAYCADFIFPTDLAILYLFDRRPPAPGLILVTAAPVVLLTLAVLAVRKRFPFLTVGWLWFLVTITPVLGLVQAGLQGRADRFAYIPFLGLSLAAAWTADRFTGAGGKRLRLPVWGGFALLVAILAALTVHQVGYWRDDITLFSRAVEVDRKNWLAHYNLGTAYLKKRNHQAALVHLTAAYELNPRDEAVSFNVGAALRDQGKTKEAVAWFRAHIRDHPGDAGAHRNLGALLILEGDEGEAEDHLRQAVRLDPRDVEARLILANVLASSGNLAEAEDHYRRVVALSPGLAVAHNNLGVILARLGRMGEAEDEFHRALTLDPSLDDARRNLMDITGEKVPDSPVAP